MFKKRQNKILQLLPIIKNKIAHKTPTPTSTYTKEYSYSNPILMTSNSDDIYIIKVYMYIYNLQREKHLQAQNVKRFRERQTFPANHSAVLALHNIMLSLCYRMVSYVHNCALSYATAMGVLWDLTG